MYSGLCAGEAVRASTEPPSLVWDDDTKNLAKTTRIQKFIAGLAII
jgi:hypothetical protein